MSFRCRDCGAELVRKPRGVAVRRPSAAPPPLPDRPAPRAVAGAVALENPYQAPRAMPHPPLRVGGGVRALASRSSRLSAQIVDGLIGFGIALLLYTPLMMGSLPESSVGMGAMLFWLFGMFALAIYQMFLLSRDGQSLGKKAMKIRIVRYDDDGNPGFGRAVGLRLFVNALIGLVPFYAIVDLLFIFGSERRCLHDYIAGTKVIEA